MTPELAQILNENLDLAMVWGYTMNPFFSLVEKNGHYMARENYELHCHPLETIILGQKITDCVNVDIAKNLGVNLQWVDGFLDGYNGNAPDSVYIALSKKDPARSRYLEGWKDGEEVATWVADMEW